MELDDGGWRYRDDGCVECHALRWRRRVEAIHHGGRAPKLVPDIGPWSLWKLDLTDIKRHP